MNKNEIIWAMSALVTQAKKARCETVHHGKKDTHMFYEPCPACDRIIKQAEIVKEFIEQDYISHIKFRKNNAKQIS